MRMKYLNIFSVLVLVVLVSGCKKKNPIDQNNQQSRGKYKEFVVSYNSSNSGKKVSINNNLDVLWSEKDQILVATSKETEDGNNKKPFSLIQGAETTHGTFGGEITESDEYFCLFPYRSATPPSIAGMPSQPMFSTCYFSEDTNELSEFLSMITNTYLSEKIGSTNNTIIGVGTSYDGNHFKMKHLSGILRIRIKADKEDMITEIILTDNDNKQLSGIFTVDPNLDNPTIVFRDDNVTFSSTKIVMTLEDGVDIGPSGYTVFDFAIPGGIGIFENGFTAKLAPLLGDTIVIASSEATIEKGYITTAERFVIIPEKKKKQIEDICGNKYEEVEIGNQIWLSSNIKCNKYDTESEAYAKGITDIKYSYKSVIGISPSTYEPFYYSDNSVYSSSSTFGYLYNYAASMGYESKEASQAVITNQTNRQGICPNGYRVPTISDWLQLNEYIENVKDDWAGKYLKSTDRAVWAEYNDKYFGNDDFGFSAVPAGYLQSKGSWTNTPNSKNYYVYFISATPGVIITKSNTSNHVYTVQLSYNDKYFTDSEDNEYSKQDALSVRCIKK